MLFYQGFQNFLYCPYTLFSNSSLVGCCWRVEFPYNFPLKKVVMNLMLIPFTDCQTQLLLTTREVGSIVGALICPRQEMNLLRAKIKKLVSSVHATSKCMARIAKQVKITPYLLDKLLFSPTKKGLK